MSLEIDNLPTGDGDGKKKGQSKSLPLPVVSTNYGVDMSAYTRYMDQVRPSTNIDLHRALEQPWTHQAANALTQAAGTIVGDTITGVGAIGEIASYAFGADQDFDNAMMQFGESISQGSRDIAPIYRTDPNRALNLSDSGWWFSMFPSMVSTVSMMVPGYGAAKGLSYLGKGARALKLTNGIAKAAKTGAKVVGAADAAIAGKQLTDFSKLLVKAGTGAAVSRNAENFREAHDIYKERYDSSIEQSQTEEGWNEITSSLAYKDAQEFMGKQDVSPEEYAEYAGSRSAWRSYNVNKVNYMFDVLQFALPMMKGSGMAIKGLKEAKDVAALAGKTLSRAEKFKYAVGPGSAIGIESITEGMEEMVNFVGGTVGRDYIDVINGVEDPDRIDTASEFLSDGHLWEGALLGAIGGGAFAGGAHIANRDSRIEARTKRINALQERMGEITSYMDQVKEVVNSDAPKADKEVSLENLMKTQAFASGVKSSITGTYAHMEEILSSPAFQEKLKENMGQEGENLEKTMADFRGYMEKGKKSFNKYRGYFTRSTLNPVTSAVLSENAAQLELYRDLQKDTLASYESEYADLLAKIPEADVAKEGFHDSLEYAATQMAYARLTAEKKNAIEELERRSKRDKVSAAQKDFAMSNLRANYDSKLSALEKKTEELSKTKGRLSQKYMAKHTPAIIARSKAITAQSTLDSIYEREAQMHDPKFQQQQDEFFTKREKQRQKKEEKEVVDAAKTAPVGDETIAYAKDPNEQVATAAQVKAMEEQKASDMQVRRMEAELENPTVTEEQVARSQKKVEGLDENAEALLKKGKVPHGSTDLSAIFGEKGPKDPALDPLDEVFSEKGPSVPEGITPGLPSFLEQNKSPEAEPEANFPQEEASEDVAGLVDIPQDAAMGEVGSSGIIRAFDELTQIGEDGIASVGNVPASENQKLADIIKFFNTVSVGEPITLQSNGGESVAIYHQGVFVGYLPQGKVNQMAEAFGVAMLPKTMLELRSVLSENGGVMTIPFAGFTSGGHTVKSVSNQDIKGDIQAGLDQHGFYIADKSTGYTTLMSTEPGRPTIEVGKGNKDNVFSSAGVFIPVSSPTGDLVPVPLNSPILKDVPHMATEVTNVVQGVLDSYTNEAGARESLKAIRPFSVEGKNGIRVNNNKIIIPVSADGRKVTHHGIITKGEDGSETYSFQTPEGNPAESPFDLMDPVRDMVENSFMRVDHELLNTESEYVAGDKTYSNYNEFLAEKSSHSLLMYNDEHILTPFAVNKMGRSFSGVAMMLGNQVKVKKPEVAADIPKVKVVKQEDSSPLTTEERNNTLSMLEKLKAQRPDAPLTSFSDLDNGLPFTAEGTKLDSDYTADLDTMEAEWREMFPTVPFVRIKGLIEMGGQRAFGMFTGAAAMISDRAIAGTHFHEAFHTAMHLYLSESERNEIYKEGRSWIASLSEAEAANLKARLNISGDTLTDLQVEEFLAEKFRSEMIVNGIDQKPKTAIGRWFKTLQRWVQDVKRYFSGSQTKKMDKLFQNIRSGRFQYEATPQMKNHVKRMNLALPVPGFTHAQVSELVDGLMPFFDKVLQDTRATWTQVQKDGTNFNEEVKYRFMLSLYAESGKLDKAAQESLETVLLRMDSTEDYRGFYDLIMERYDAMGISIADLKNSFDEAINENEDITEEELDQILDENAQGHFESWTQSKTEYDARKKASANVKRAIAFTVDVESLITKGVIDLDAMRKSLNGDKKYTPTVRKGLFGLGAYLDYNSTYNYLKQNLAGVTSSEDMLKRMADLVNYNPSLIGVVNKVLRSETLQQEFYSEFNKQSPEMIRKTMRKFPSKEGEMARPNFQVQTMNKSEGASALSGLWEVSFNSNARLDVGAFNQLPIGEAYYQEAGKALTDLGLQFGKLEWSAVLRRLFTSPALSNDEKKASRRKLNDILFRINATEGKRSSDAKKVRGLEFYKLGQLVERFDARLEATTYTMSGGGSIFNAYHNHNMGEMFNLIKGSNNLEKLAFFQQIIKDPRARNSRWVQAFVGFEESNGEYPSIYLKTDAKSKQDQSKYGYALSLGAHTEESIFEGNKDKNLTDTDVLVQELHQYFSEDGESVYFTQITPNASTFAVKVPRMTGEELAEAAFDAVLGEAEAARRMGEYLFEDINTFPLVIKEEHREAAARGEFGMAYRDTDKSGRLLGEDGKPLGNIFQSQIFSSTDFLGLASENGIPQHYTQEIKAKLGERIGAVIDSETDWLMNTLKNLEKSYKTLPKISRKDARKFILHYRLHNYEMGNFVTGHASDAKNVQDYFKRINNGTSMLIRLDPSVTSSSVNVMVGRDISRDAKSIQPTEGTNVLSSPMGKALIEAGVSGKEAKVIINNFKGIDAQDAQGYITMDRYREIVRGRFGDDPEWNATFEAVENGTATERQLTKFMTPIKGSFAGKVFDQNTGLYEMHQVKYSALPLTPGLVAMAPGLKKLDDYMRANGIQEYVPQSAYKLGAKNLASPGKETFESLENLHVQALPQAIYGISQDVPAKLIDAKSPLGSQLSKLILANLDMDAKYSIGGIMKTGKEIFDTYQDTLTDWLEAEFDSLLSEMGATKLEGDAGYMFDSLESLSKILYSSITSRGEATDVLKEAVQVKNNGFVLPLYHPGISSKVESVYASLFNKALVAIKTPGTSAVQASSVGFEGSEFERPTLKFKNGGIQHAEVYLPQHMRYKFFNKNTPIPIDEIDPSLLEIIGFRIPTEYKGSAITLKVKGFLPPELANTVVVPDELVTMMGSDFDLDKIFMMYRDTSEGKLSEVRNTVFDIFKGVLSSKNSIQEMLTPQDPARIREAAHEVAKDSGLSDPYSFQTRMELRKRDAAGAKMIGVAANYNVFGVVAQSTKMEHTEGFLMTYRRRPTDTDATWSARKKALKRDFDEATESPDGAMTVLHKRIGHTKTGFTDPDGNLILDNVRQFVAAAADNTKDPLYGFFNGNQQTINTIMTMVLSGVPYQEAFALSTHPEVVKRSSQRELRNSDFTTDFTKEKESSVEEVKQFEAISEIGASMSIASRVFKADNVSPGSNLASAHSMVLGRDQIVDAFVIDGKPATGQIFGEDSKYPILKFHMENTHQGTLDSFGTQTYIDGEDGRIMLEAAMDAMGITPTQRNLITMRAAANVFSMIDNAELRSRNASQRPNSMEEVNRIMGTSGIPPIEDFQKLDPGRKLLILRRSKYGQNLGLNHFLSRLSPQFSANVEADQFKGTLKYLPTRDVDAKNDISDSITEMFNMEGPAGEYFRDFILDAVSIAFYDQKMKFGGTNFGELFSASIMNSPEINLSESMESAKKNLGYTANAYVEFMVLNYPDLIKQAPQQSKEDLSTIEVPDNSTRFFKYRNNLYVRNGEDSAVRVAPLRKAGDPINLSGIPQVAQESRTLGERFAPENKGTAKDKAAFLVDTFQKAGINVEVVYGDIDAHGQVETTGTNSARITLNEDRLQEDTIIHEFGHIYVDLLGVENPLVAQAIEELKGTDLWREVAKAYPELDAVSLSKEVLVTAIGKEGAKIYNDERKQRKWQTLLNKIFRAIGNLFGLGPNSARKLAAEMLSGNIQRNFKGSLNAETQYSKYAQSYEEFAKQTTLDLERIIVQFGKQSSLSEMEALMKALETKTSEGSAELINAYLDSRLASFEESIEQFKIFEDDPTLLEKDNNRTIFFNFIHQAALELQSFENLASINERWAETDEERKEIEELHAKAPRVSKVLSKLSEYRRRELEKELRKYSSNPKIIADVTTLLDYASDYKRDLGVFDESWAQLNLDSLADSNVPVVGAAMNMYKTRKAEFELETTRMLQDWEKFVEEYGDVLDDLIVKDKDGNSTITLLSQTHAVTHKKQWDAIQADPRKKHALEYVRKVLTEAVEHTENDYISKGYIPAVPIESMKDVYRKALNITQKDDINDSVRLDSKGAVFGVIPIQYAKHLPLSEEVEKEIGIEEIPATANKSEIRAIQSRNARRRTLWRVKNTDKNIAETIPMLLKSARKHQFKSEIFSTMHLVGEQLQHMKFRTRRNALDAIANRGKGENDALAYEMVDGAKSNIYKHWKDWMQMVFYEDFDQSPAVLSNIAKNIQNYTSLTGIGFNVFSGLNNRIYGGIQQSIEAAAGEHFGRKSYLRAKKEFNKNLMTIIGDRKKTASDNKLSATLKFFDILQSQDELSKRKGGPARSAIHRLLWVKDAAYAMQHMGEYTMQNQVLLA